MKHCLSSALALLVTVLLGPPIWPQGPSLPEGVRLRLGSNGLGRTHEDITAGIGYRKAAIARDASVFAISNAQDRILIYDAKTLKLIQAVDVAVLPDEMWFSSRQQHLWLSGCMANVRTGKVIGLQPAPAKLHNVGLIDSADGAFIAGTLVNETNARPVLAPAVWDASTGKLIRAFEGGQDLEVAIAASRDGKVLASYSKQGGDPKNPSNGIIRFWTIPEGKKLSEFSSPDGAIAPCTFTEDGGEFLTIAHSGVFRRFNVKTSIQLPTVRLESVENRASEIQILVDGRTAIAGDFRAGFQLWDLASGKLRQIPKAPEGNLIGVGVNPAGQVIALGMRGQNLFLYDIIAGAMLTPIAGHNFRATSLAFTKDGRQLLSASADGDVIHWDALTGQILRRRRLSVHADVPAPDAASREMSSVISPNLKYFAAYGDSREMRVWEIESEKFLPEGFIAGLPSRLSSVAFSPSQDELVVAYHDSSVGVRELHDGEQVRRINRATSAESAPVQVTHAVAVSPDGKRIASLRAIAKYQSDTLKAELSIWDAATSKAIIHQKEVNVHRDGHHARDSLAFSPDGKDLAVFGNGIELVDPSTGRPIRRFQTAFKWTNTIAYSPDGRMLAVAARRERAYQRESPCSSGFGSEYVQSLELFETATGRRRYSSAGNGSPISSLAFSPDCMTLATGSGDTTVLLWDLGPIRNPIGEREREAAWTTLAGHDAADAFTTMRRLMQSPGQASAWLAEKLPNVKIDEADRKSISKWVAGLADRRFGVREEAHRMLREMGEWARDELELALATEITLETRRRVQTLLDELRVNPVPPEKLRFRRALEVLERIGSNDARELLTRLAAGPPSWRTTLARETLDRLPRSASPK